VTAQNGWKPAHFTAEALAALQAHSWPGNVRELRNIVERLMLLAPGDEVDLATIRLALPQGLKGPAAAVPDSGSLAERVQTFEREVLLAELKRNHNNVTSAAKALHLERSHFYKKAEQLGVDLRAVRKEQDPSHD
jgi:DNA-binding NtrC family response regulator